VAYQIKKLFANREEISRKKSKKNSKLKQKNFPKNSAEILFI
jgi:hypothetical protein